MSRTRWERLTDWTWNAPGWRVWRAVVDGLEYLPNKIRDWEMDRWCAKHPVQPRPEVRIDDLPVGWGGIDSFEFSTKPADEVDPAALPGMAPATMTLKGRFTGPLPAYPTFKPGFRVIALMEWWGKADQRIVTKVLRNEFVDGEAVLEYESRPVTADDGPMTREQRSALRRMRWNRAKGALRAKLPGGSRDGGPGL